MSVMEKDILGAWHLQQWRIELPDGRVHYPFGETPKGQILYTADGQMSATIMADARTGFGAASARQISDAQKAAAFDGYFHYAGHWSLEGDVVVHDVTLSLNPDFIGTQQRRQAHFQDPYHLTLSAKEEVKGKGWRHHFIDWFREENESWH